MVLSHLAECCSSTLRVGTVDAIPPSSFGTRHLVSPLAERYCLRFAKVRAYCHQKSGAIAARGCSLACKPESGAGGGRPHLRGHFEIADATFKPSALASCAWLLSVVRKKPLSRVSAQATYAWCLPAVSTVTTDRIDSHRRDSSSRRAALIFDGFSLNTSSMISSMARRRSFSSATVPLTGWRIQSGSPLSVTCTGWPVRVIRFTLSVSRTSVRSEIVFMASDTRG